MNRTKYLKGECQHCGGHLEFLADHIGTVVPCPHCHQETELLLLPPPREPTLPRRAFVWTGIAVVILGLGFWGALIALKRAQRSAARQKEQTAAAPAVQIPATPVETNLPTKEELSASELTLEKTPGSSLIYAVGTVTNSSTRQRFGVKIEVELLDATGQKIGVASDYRQVLQAGAQWQFKALVLDSKAKSAKLSSIKEDQQ